MSYPDVQKVVNLSNRIRKAGNELVGVMKKNYEQLMRTKKVPQAASAVWFH